MRRILALIALIFTANLVMAAPLVVNCDAHQSLNRTLSVLNKQVPTTVWVKGTCTEYVTINGFDGLTLKGYPGARLIQPSVDPRTGLFVWVLSIEASRSVTIDGLTIHSESATGGVGIARGSIDVRLRNLTFEGGGPAVFIYENSQASLARVVAHVSGWAGVAVYDLSDAHIEDCLFEQSAGGFSGISVGAGHVTMHNTTIRNTFVGISIGQGGIVDIWDYNTYYPIGGPLDVVIESPAGTNFYGVSIADGGSLNLKGTADAKLRIINPGQPWGGNTGGVLVSNGSTLNAGINLEISGSRGHGVYVTGNSHASLSGSRIIGSAHGGLVAVNLSTIAVGSGNPITEVSGNSVDVFCDSRSLITGGAGIANATVVQCGNLLPYDSEPTP